MTVALRVCPEPPGGGNGARVGEDTVVYALGDLHGRDDLLDEMLDAVVADAAGRDADRRVIVCLGDYLSRGPGSRAVLDRILAGPPPGFEAVCLKGNHEDIVLRYLDGDIDWGRHWLNYGGVEALAAYGVPASRRDRDDAGALIRLRRELLEAAPPAHLAFLRLVRTSHREGDFLFVHAGLRPGVPLGEQSETDLMWIRDHFLECADDFGVIVVHGHCIVPTPEVRDNRIAIDTGAYRSGVLTALVLHGAGRWFLQTGADA